MKTKLYFIIIISFLFCFTAKTALCSQAEKYDNKQFIHKLLGAGRLSRKLSDFNNVNVQSLIDSDLANYEKYYLPIPKLYDRKLKENSKPGDLLGYEECTDHYYVKDRVKLRDAKITVWRYVYVSKKPNGKLVPASALVLVPQIKSNRKLPLIVWAHGTSGIARINAPSLMKNWLHNWDYWFAPLAWALSGYAVVAPDYAGLGTDTPHLYCAMEAQKNDLIYAQKSAMKLSRSINLNLDERFVGIGHSQGGGPAIQMTELKNPKNLGAIGIAPSGDIQYFMEQFNKNPHATYYIMMILIRIHDMYQDFNPTDLLVDSAKPYFYDTKTLVMNNHWFINALVMEQLFPKAGVLKNNWSDNKYFQKFRQATFIGNRPTFGSILLITGGDDIVVPYSRISKTAEKLRLYNPNVIHRNYLGYGHGPVLIKSIPDQIKQLNSIFNYQPENPDAAKKQIEELAGCINYNYQ